MVKQLYSILNEFKNPKYLIEQEIYRKVRDFNDEQLKSKKFPIDSDFFYEEIAFNLMEMSQECNVQGWEGLYYGPTISAKDKNGNIISNLDIKNITPEMVSYWERRSSEVDNPILQCRYAGLVWDFSQKIKKLKPNVSVAHRLIDSILKIASLGGDCFFNKLEKALRLAVALNDQQRIIFIRDAIIKYEDTYSEDGKPGTWGYSYDLLIEDKNLYRKVQLEKKQEDRIIKELERKLKKFSDRDTNICNPHSVEYIVTKLAPYYKGKGDMENMKRVLLIYRDSFLYGIKYNLVMIGSHWLEKIRKILFQYGLSKEAKELELNIRTLQKDDLKYLQRHTIKIPIPQEEIDRYMSDLSKKNLSEALNCIALSFIPDKEQVKNIVIKTAREHPLQATITKSIMDHTGKIVSQINSIEDDLEGHIVHHISQSMRLQLSFIALGLSHLEENKSLGASSLSEHLFKSPVFTEANHPIIKEGLISYFNKNYIATCSILIHQIESAIRELISVAGGAIYQPSTNSKERGFELRPLGALIRDEIFTKTFEKLNNNIPDFFRILLIDKRALNLRNSICHGHLPATSFNQGVAIHIIHVLLILSILRKNKSSLKTKKS